MLATQRRRRGLESAIRTFLQVVKVITTTRRTDDHLVVLLCQAFMPVIRSWVYRAKSSLAKVEFGLVGWTTAVSARGGCAFFTRAAERLNPASLCTWISGLFVPRLSSGSSRIRH